MKDIATAPQSPHASRFDAGCSNAWLPSLLIITLCVRLIAIAISKPLLGNFATKSVIYAMIAKNWVEGQNSLWYPTLDVMLGPHRSLYMLEFPFSAYLTGCLWNIFGGSLPAWGRVTSIGFSVASVWLLYLLVKNRHGRTAAFGAGIVLALSPFAIVYGQDFTIEASLVFFTVATFYCLQSWLTGSHKIVASFFWLAAFGLCFALLLLTKIVMLVLLLPLVYMIFCEYRGCEGNRDIPDSSHTKPIQPRKKSARIACLLVLGLAILPAAAWYIHAGQTASPDCELSGRVYYSVRHGAVDHRPPHPLLAEPDFYCRLLDDLMGPVLTPLGFVLLGLGFLDRRWGWYATWLVASAVLIIALPRKFHELNYYFMTILPPLCIIAGLGWALIIKHLRPGRIALALWLLVALTVSLRYTLGPLAVIPAEDQGVLAASEMVKVLTEEDEPIVMMHGTAIVLPYYCDRPAWRVLPDKDDIKTNIEDYRRLGARIFVVAGENEPDLDKAGMKLQEVAKGQGFWIYRL